MDDGDLAVCLSLISGVCPDDRADAPECLFAFLSGDRVGSDLHLAAAHLEPDCVRVLEDVLEPGRMTG